MKGTLCFRWTKTKTSKERNKAVRYRSSVHRFWLKLMNRSADVVFDYPGHTKW